MSARRAEGPHGARPDGLGPLLQAAEDHQGVVHLLLHPLLQRPVRRMHRVVQVERRGRETEGHRTRRGEEGSDGHAGALWNTLSAIDSKGRVRAQVRAQVRACVQGLHTQGMHARWWPCLLSEPARLREQAYGLSVSFSSQMSALRSTWAQPLCGMGTTPDGTYCESPAAACRTGFGVLCCRTAALMYVRAYDGPSLAASTSFRRFRSASTRCCCSSTQCVLPTAEAGGKRRGLHSHAPVTARQLSTTSVRHAMSFCVGVHARTCACVDAMARAQVRVPQRWGSTAAAPTSQTVEHFISIVSAVVCNPFGSPSHAAVRCSGSARGSRPCR